MLLLLLLLLLLCCGVCCGVVVVWLLWCCCVSGFFFMKAILAFFDFWDIFVVFDFSFHLCYDLPQVSNCYESDSFIF